MSAGPSIIDGRTSDPLAIARGIRSVGCPGHAGVATPLHTDGQLNSAADRWSQGAALRSAIERSGFRARASSGLHVRGDSASLAPEIRRTLCTALTDRGMTDIGLAQNGEDHWIIVAARFSPPAMADAAQMNAEWLTRLNAARSQARRCGDDLLPAVAPLTHNVLLDRAAQGHADDMLAHSYFAHEGLDGSTPATRVTAVGYRHRIVGENIAEGPNSVAEAMQGWLQSPPHCHNIMDSRFAETGFGYAVNRSGTPRSEWVQEFATAR